jgi:hypothetical protein
VSICGEWADGLALIAEEAASQRTFQLAVAAVPESLSVAVNREVRDGWSYDEATWTVRFTSNAPRAGDAVAIRYDAAN